MDKQSQAPTLISNSMFRRKFSVASITSGVQKELQEIQRKFPRGHSELYRPLQRIPQTRKIPWRMPDMFKYATVHPEDQDL
jgi:hypothetical protein